MKILLGISGSIAAYKMYDLARELVKERHEVKVILTKGALNFIQPDTFRYLGVTEVYSHQDDFKYKLLDANQNVLHIQLSKWSDKIIIAPLSANTLARLSLGITDDLLSSVVLASPNKPILLFPAMNTEMWNNSRTGEHLKRMQSITNVSIFMPTHGQLACGDVGVGKMPDIKAIKNCILHFNPMISKDIKILLTAGATASPIDAVRYVTNPSSGKMGLEIAKAFLREGYKVTILAGHNCSEEINDLTLHPYFNFIKAPTTEEMKNYALDLFPKVDLYISTGAIADIEFEPQTEKLKKEKMGNELQFKQAADILKEILKIKESHQKVVSFAAETDTSKEVFMEKFNRKPVDLMIGNKVSNGLVNSPLLGFQKQEGYYYFIRSQTIQGPVELTKTQVGEKLVTWFERDQL